MMFKESVETKRAALLKVRSSLAESYRRLQAAVFPFLGSEFTPTLKEGTIVVSLTMAPSIAITESKRTAIF